MIVRNESHVIRRCLLSVLEFIDAAVIVDTGSTDSTMEDITDIIYDLPHELHSRRWNNFGENRTEALQLARRAFPDSLAFIIDADEEFRPEFGFDMPREGGPFAAWQTCADGRYLRPQLLDLKRNWRYEGAIHEYAVCDDNPPMTVLRHCETHGHFDSYRNQQGRAAKFRSDAALLQQLPQTPRNVFYLAESWRGAKEWTLAMLYYEQRAFMKDGCEQEKWWSSLMLAVAMKECGCTQDEICMQFSRAIYLRPQRAESYIFFARYLHSIGDRVGSKHMFNRTRSMAVPNDTLNIISECYGIK